ncbi:MAG: hypothetical protein JXR88_01505 [Clostridia bacterium]|nr:hypothetical protein [Clostridia bacterium]
MSIGFTFDEKILSEMSLDSFLNQIKPNFKSVEIAPDEILLPFSNYEKVAKSFEQHHFHIPYFVKEKQYFSTDHFSDYERFFIIVDKLRQYSIKRPNIVFHPSSEKETLQACDRLLNFITRKKIDVTLTLENISETPPSELKKYLEVFKSPKLQICYDLAHDYYNKNYEGIHEIKDYLAYIHLHGKDEIKHQSIQFLPTSEILKMPKSVDLNLELLYATQPNYFNTLLEDFNYLNTLL